MCFLFCQTSTSLKKQNQYLKNCFFRIQKYIKNTQYVTAKSKPLIFKSNHVLHPHPSCQSTASLVWMECPILSAGTMLMFSVDFHSGPDVVAAEESCLFQSICPWMPWDGLQANGAPGWFGESGSRLMGSVVRLDLAEA